MTTDAPLRFLKGHGTENDFVLLPDVDGRLELDAGLVRALCDRRAGIGGDGVLRVVRADAAPETAGQAGAEWFMDYRNADGSIAEMCGNGIRVFGRYLVHAGLASPGPLAVATRGGLKRLTVPEDGDVIAEMGPAAVIGDATATLGGFSFAGVAISMGNPHLVCATHVPVEELDLTSGPAVESALFPAGVNVEFTNVLDAGRVRMRVHERGVGETRSCGTGAVAAGVAALRAAGQESGTVTVLVPGGAVRVGLSTDGTTLEGPAVIVGEGVVDSGWMRHARSAGEVLV